MTDETTHTDETEETIDDIARRLRGEEPLKRVSPAAEASAEEHFQVIRGQAAYGPPGTKPDDETPLDEMTAEDHFNRTRRTR